jgi:peroxiredoxin family protein
MALIKIKATEARKNIHSLLKNLTKKDEIHIVDCKNVIAILTLKEPADRIAAPVGLTDIVKNWSDFLSAVSFSKAVFFFTVKDSPPFYVKPSNKFENSFINIWENLVKEPA